MADKTGNGTSKGTGGATGGAEAKQSASATPVRVAPPLGSGSPLLSTCLGLMNLGEQPLEPRLLLALLSLVNLADILALINGTANAGVGFGVNLGGGGKSGGEQTLLSTLTGLLSKGGRQGQGGEGLDKTELLGMLLRLLSSSGANSEGGNLDLSKLAPLIGLLSQLKGGGGGEEKKLSGSPPELPKKEQVDMAREGEQAEAAENNERSPLRASGWSRLAR